MQQKSFSFTKVLCYKKIVVLDSYSNDEFSTKIIVIGKWICISFSSPSSIILIFNQLSFLSSSYNIASLKFSMLVTVISCYILLVLFTDRFAWNRQKNLSFYGNNPDICKSLSHFNSVSAFTQYSFNSIKIACISTLYSFLMFPLNPHNYFNLSDKEIPWK